MTKPYDETVLYPDDLLVDYANHLLSAADSSIRATSVSYRGERHVQFEALDSRGKQVGIVIPTGSQRTGMLFARSLLKVRPGAGKVSWLINGQHSTGTTEIAFYGENGPLLTVPADNVRAYYRTVREHLREDGKERFDASLEDRVREAAKEGFLSDVAEIHVWDDGHRHAPLREPEAAPAP